MKKYQLKPRSLKVSVCWRAEWLNVASVKDLGFQNI